MSGRAAIAMDAEEVRAFLAEEQTLICASHGHDGWPHLMPLWYVVRDTGAGGGPELWGWTYARSQKVRNLQRDPRASAQVEAGEEYAQLRGVLLRCSVELVRDPDAVAEIGAGLATRYGGAELDEGAREAIRAQAAKRVGLRFVEAGPRASWDHRKLRGGY